jgi:hypothetical protein
MATDHTNTLKTFLAPNNLPPTLPRSMPDTKRDCSCIAAGTHRGMIDKCCRWYCTIHMSAHVFCRQAGALATHERRTQEGPMNEIPLPRSRHTASFSGLHRLVPNCPYSLAACTATVLLTPLRLLRSARSQGLKPCTASSATGTHAALSHPEEP